MNKQKTLYFLLAITLFFLFQPSTVRAYSSNNIDLAFKNASVENVRFDLHDWIYPSGKSDDNNISPRCYPATYKDGKWRFTFYIDRKNDESIINWLHYKLNMNTEAITTQSGFRAPGDSKYNFALQGTLLFEYKGVNYHFDDVIFAQYHSGINNPWIFAQPYSKRIRGVEDNTARFEYSRLKFDEYYWIFPYRFIPDNDNVPSFYQFNLWASENPYFTEFAQ